MLVDFNKKGTRVVHADTPPERWFVLEEFSRQYGVIWTIAIRRNFFGLFQYWERPTYVYWDGTPEFNILAPAKVFYSLPSAIEIWRTIKTWEAKELEKKMRKKFPSRIVFPIFVSPTETTSP